MARKGTFRETHDATVYAYGLVPKGSFPEEAIQNLFEANKFCPSQPWTVWPESLNGAKDVWCKDFLPKMAANGTL